MDTDCKDTQSPPDAELTDPTAGSLRLKKLKTNTSNGTLGQIYSAGPTPTLLDGSGNSKAIKNVQLDTRGSTDLVSLRSPTHSRNSSAHSLYSTSATTIEEGDERRGRDDASAVVNNEAKRRNSGKGGKGNVIVSVRVRPEAGEEKNSSKDWFVDGRQSLVVYRGREGGNYHYGKQDLFLYTSFTCHPRYNSCAGQSTWYQMKFVLVLIN